MGSKGRLFICVLYVFELLSIGMSSCMQHSHIGICSVIIFGDTLETMIPSLLTSLEWKILGILLMVILAIPGSSVVMTITSASGVSASISLLCICMYDVLIPRDGAPSVWNPKETRLFPAHISDIFINFGLVLFCFSGHSVMPSIYKDEI